MIRGRKNLGFFANTAECDRSCHLAPSGECKRNIVARMGEPRFCLHWAFKHAPLLRIPLCISWAFLVIFELGAHTIQVDVKTATCPKFHYADFATKSGTCSRQSCGHKS